jgi:hypothetical protein
VDLLIVQLKAAIRRLLDTKGVRGRVLDKVNRYGEVVIGVILEKPAPGGAPKPPDEADADADTAATSTDRDDDEIARGRGAR